MALSEATVSVSTTLQACPWRHPPSPAQFDPEDSYSALTVTTIVTTKPNDRVRTIHPERMPVILHEAEYEAWLNGSQDEALKLLKSYPAAVMRIVHSGVVENMDAVDC